MNEVVEIGLWIILSGVKFLFAVLPLLAQSHRAWYWDMLIVSSGGILGVFAFTYLGAYVSAYLSKFNFFKIKYPKLKKFIKLKNSYGLIGIALLSPIMISIPIGCMLSASFENNKHKVLTYHIASVIFWSILLFGLKGLFNIDLSKQIHVIK